MAFILTIIRSVVVLFPLVYRQDTASSSEAGDVMVYTRPHADEKPYACQQCSKCFSKASQLRGHSQSHVGDKSFARARKLSARARNGEKSYLCQQCFKRFYQASHLREHSRIHSGEKPHSCQLCSKKFSKASHLREHTRIHTGEKPFECQLCCRRFSKSGDVKQHCARVHTGEKPYACQRCEKRFVEACRLKEHTRTHTGDKPYACELCSKRFTVAASLKAHGRIHADDWSPAGIRVAAKRLVRSRIRNCEKLKHAEGDGFIGNVDCKNADSGTDSIVRDERFLRFDSLTDHDRPAYEELLCKSEAPDEVLDSFTLKKSVGDIGSGEKEFTMDDGAIDSKSFVVQQTGQCPSYVKLENVLSCDEPDNEYKPEADWKLLVEPFVRLVRQDIRITNE